MITTKSLHQNWNAAELQEMWCGILHTQVLWGVPYKGEIQLDDRGGEAYIYIKQIKKSMYFEFYYI
jgi:hypothetical protein